MSRPVQTRAGQVDKGKVSARPLPAGTRVHFQLWLHLIKYCYDTVTVSLNLPVTHPRAHARLGPNFLTFRLKAFSHQQNLARPKVPASCTNHHCAPKPSTGRALTKGRAYLVTPRRATLPALGSPVPRQTTIWFCAFCIIWIIFGAAKLISALCAFCAIICSYVNWGGNLSPNSLNFP